MASLITFPLIERVIVRGYDLYPGRENSGVLDLDLNTGPWLVLGVNGLGKSTLLLLMRYLLAGPVRTRSAGFAGEREDLQSVNNRFFAVRVLDGAQDAVASIRVRFGTSVLTVERSLANLSITTATVERAEGGQSLASEEDYRNTITTLMGVAQFEDVVRVLDHLVFYLEARQALIWDGAAQFELFRALLTPNLSADLRRLEGEIVSADSTARNLNATLYKITTRREKEAAKRVSADDTRARISAAQGELDAIVKHELKIAEELDAAELQRSDYNLQQKRGEQAVDDAAQAYEKLKFEVLRQAFAGVKPTEQYIFLKMLSDRICIACNQTANATADELQARSDSGKCVICGNVREFGADVGDISDVLKAKASDAFDMLEALRLELEKHKRQHSHANGEVLRLHQTLSGLRFNAEEKQNFIRRMRKLLPADESLALGLEEDRIATLRREVQTFRQEREIAEREIDTLLTTLKSATEEIRERLEKAFDAQAAPFFAESVRLVYAPRTAKIGQGGRSFEFPAFEVEMTSGATLTQYVRRAPEQVSLSQREYLDVIFRMILIEVLGAGTGTLVVDGPEGSLDAVFAGRAGDLFARFSNEGGANVVLACNIVEGGFIPHTLAGHEKADRSARVINLLDQASPTQALTTLRPLYLAKVAEILAREPNQ